MYSKMEEYMVYLEEFWFYLPYIIYAYVFLTFLPKSVSRIKKFADEDYEANRYKYHRCYGPESCCHTSATADKLATPIKVKSRKPVTRIYPKRNSVATDSGCTSTSTSTSPPMKRTVQTCTHVNEIARMFETGGVASNNNTPIHKKINRVPPTIYPSELKNGLKYFNSNHQQQEQQQQQQQKITSNFVKLRPVPKVEMQRRSSAEEFAEMLLAENLLDLEDLELIESCEQVTHSKSSNDCLTTTTATTTNRLCRGGTSATPSTASPAASCSPMSASPPASPRQFSPAPAIKSSLDDIFAAIAQNAEKSESELNFMCSADAAANLLPPVTSIDDILSQRRLSRPLSAYSISDLLLSEENSKTLTTEPKEEELEASQENTPTVHAFN